MAVTGPPSPAPAPGWREWLSRRRWGVALGVGIVFAATLGVVTLVELAGQRSLADITGDSSGQTSIGSFLDGSDSGADDGQTPAGASTTVAPGDDPSATDTDDPATSTDEDSPTPPTRRTTTSDTTTPPSTSPTEEEPAPADGASATDGAS